MILILLGIHSLLLLLFHQGLAGDPPFVAKRQLAEQPGQPVNNRMSMSDNWSYKKRRFLEKYVDEVEIPLPPDVYCNILVRNRNIMVSSSPCKKEHYFIHDSWNNILKLCENNNIPCKNSTNSCHQSTKTMAMTTCRLLNGDQFPYCEYISIKKKKKVVLSCKQLKGYPSLFPDSVEKIVE